jgi:uncharacterized protein
MNDFKKITIILCILLFLSSLLNVFLYSKYVEYDGYLKNLQTKVNALSSENAMLKESLEVLKRSLPYHPTNVSLSGKWIYIAGVIQTDGGYEGEILRVYARFVEGSGKVFIGTTPKIGIDLQIAAETAFRVAQRVSGINASSFDCILTVAANRTIDVVDGPSAGAAITSLLSSILQGKEIRRDVVITGAIQGDGSLGSVGGIIEKAMAAAKIGAKIFLVPKGQTKVVVWKQKVTQMGSFRIIEYIPEVVGVEDYLRNEGFEIKVIEVENIFEALQYLEV